MFSFIVEFLYRSDQIHCWIPLSSQPNSLLTLIIKMNKFVVNLLLVNWPKNKRPWNRKVLKVEINDTEGLRNVDSEVRVTGLVSPIPGSLVVPGRDGYNWAESFFHAIDTSDVRRKSSFQAFLLFKTVLFAPSLRQSSPTAMDVTLIERRRIQRNPFLEIRSR